jgi:hypothetical protein
MYFVKQTEVSMAVDKQESTPNEQGTLEIKKTESASVEEISLDEWMEKSMEAMKRMYTDEEYRREVAKRIS